ncbi:RNA polymerase subunit sigma-24 [Microbacterium sp. Gd 4-13]|uniref:RNA polymerase sigma factor n=1 Tax=Microbacterium sp. Gd 4-13 TaxID=2173179 RepID=UPI000D5674A2|nr:sigma-70 family RNA polymerase sigma factor [Microbacterium sp. Gd 4-13]PVW04829.1 RNA polymerase subunit sigma-24 [Microbacterium sp. Gd 4-13]
MRSGRALRYTGLERALEQNSADVLSYLRRRAGSEDASDLFGETLVVVWRRVEELPADADQARMWLFGVARGVLLNYRRGERRRWALADRLKKHTRLDPVAPPADEHAEVHDAIARLEPDLGELVQLVHWEHMTLVEAAQVVRIPASTARGRYQRAKEQLRAVLGTPAPL